jgi:sugar phosphate isomerase/epimerase
MNKLELGRPSRREFLGGLAAGAGWLAATRGALAQRTKPVGIQLYTVRDRMMADLPGTLARIAEIGYREVEFAGYFGRAPAEIKRIVAANGLTAPSSHVSALNTPDALEADPERVIAEAAEAGHRWIVFPFLDPRYRRTLDQYRQLADALNAFGERCHDSGMRLAYHNHDFEFHAVEGTVPYDLLVGRSEPGVVEFEVDLYWARHGGRDPRGLLAQYPERLTMCHIKDSAPDGSMVDVGAGVIDFAAIFADPNARFVHYFVEHDTPKDSMATAARSFGPASAAVNG